MVSIWWVLGAFVMGGYAGAILVGLLTINRPHEEPRAETLEGLEGLDVLDDAAPRPSF